MTKNDINISYGKRIGIALGSGGASFVSGMAAGSMDTLFNYAPYGLHYRLQRGENLLNPKLYFPKELYRGVLAYSAIIPITCICDGMTDHFVSQGTPRHIAAIQSGMMAAVIVSAPIGNAIVTNLQLKEVKQPAGTFNAIKHIRKVYGIRGFYTGIESLVIREAAYSWSVFYAKDAIQKKLECGDILSSVIAGTIGTIVSQPCDTSATYAQNQVKRIAFKEVLAKMYVEGGVRRFYYGFFFRLYAVIAGVYVMDKTSNTVKNFLGLE